MNWDWKDWFIATTLGIIGVLAMFTAVDWAIEKDSSVGVGVALSFIGAILGGMISGLLTLFGVKLTIKDQRRMVLQEKIDKADFIYKKMGIEILSLNKCIVEDEYVHSSLTLTYANVRSLLTIINDHSPILYETEFEFFRRIQAINKELECITEFFDDKGEPNIKDLREVLLICNRTIQYNFISLGDYFSKYK